MDAHVRWQERAALLARRQPSFNREIGSELGRLQQVLGQRAGSGTQLGNGQSRNLQCPAETGRRDAHGTIDIHGSLSGGQRERDVRRLVGLVGEVRQVETDADIEGRGGTE